MATIAQFQKRLSRIANKEYLNNLLLKAIKETEPIAVSLQRQQLEEGYNSEDKEVGRYTKASENIYLFEGKKANKPKIAGELFNFETTGSFLDGLELVFSNDDASFWSSDGKTKELVGRYKNLLGLDPTNFRNYILNAVFPKFMISIRKELKLL